MCRGGWLVRTLGKVYKVKEERWNELERDLSDKVNKQDFKSFKITG